MGTLNCVGDVKVNFIEGVYHVYWEIDGFFICEPTFSNIFDSSCFRLWSGYFTFRVSLKEQERELICVRLFEPRISKINPVIYIFGVLKADGYSFKTSTQLQVTTKPDFEWRELRREELHDHKDELALNGKVVFYAAIGLQGNSNVEKLLLEYIEEAKIQKPRLEDEKPVTEDGEDISEDEMEFFSCDDLSDLSVCLKDFYLKGKNGDVTIKVKGREYKAHKFILSARSAVFASMFEHRMKESIDNVVEIPDCDPDAFEDFLLYLYAGKMENYSKNILALHFIADKYEVKSLAKHCVQFMADHISVDSFCDVLALAVKHNASDLIDAAEEFFSEEMKAILLTQSWQSFIKKNPLVVNELLVKYANKMN